MSEVGRSRRFTLKFERLLSEPLPTKPLEADKRRYVPKGDFSQLEPHPLFHETTPQIRADTE